MTPEELLKPRYKVIAGIPFKPDPKSFPIGQIISLPLASSECARDENGDPVFWTEYDDYPHLFKPLHWWEERNIIDQPEYVKRKITGAVYRKNIDDGIMTYVNPTGEHLISGLWTCIPITESEYNDYINSKATKP